MDVEGGAEGAVWDRARQYIQTYTAYNSPKHTLDLASRERHGNISVTDARTSCCYNHPCHKDTYRFLPESFVLCSRTDRHPWRRLLLCPCLRGHRYWAWPSQIC